MSLSEERLPKFFQIKDTYTIDSVLGEGAFGTVYKVRHKYLGIQAIKIFHPGSITAENEALLFNEAFILSKIAHENVVRVYEANTFEYNSRKIYYIATEFVNGSTLAQYINDNVKLPISLAFNLQKDICRGLALAHKMIPPVVHRDVKPNNILLSLNGDSLKAKVADFGQAKHVDLETRLTNAGGTLAYMSPECFWNYQSPASDVFSAGMVFYLMLTGVPPYVMPVETYTQKAKAEAAIKASRTKPPLNPSTFNSNLDKDIDSLVLKSLAYESRDRYQNAEDFLEAISEYEKKGSDNLDTTILQALNYGKQYSTLFKAIELLEGIINKQNPVRKNELMVQYGAVLSSWKRGIMM